MREIGGYIELDTYTLPMLHEGAIALNCGRNALAYLFKARTIKKIKLPYFICASIPGVCEREGVSISWYHVGYDFLPVGKITLEDEEWLYLVNFYGQLSNDVIHKIVDEYQRVIVDQANGYFENPLEGVDTLYTCRKWFGVPDGAFLYTDAENKEDYPRDESFERMHFLLGRYERTAPEFYSEYTANNSFFINEPIKKMSRLTWNLLHGIDYKWVDQRRRENFLFLHEKLGQINQLTIVPGTFMYPFMIENGKKIRKRLQENKIYIPTLWPKVFELTNPGETEYQMSENILPLPIDQRYGIEDIEYIVQELEKCIN